MTYSKEDLQQLLLQELFATQPDPASAIRHLGAVQIDPVNIVTQNQHLVLANRIDNYNPRDLEKSLEHNEIIDTYPRERGFVAIDDFDLYYHKLVAHRERYKPILKEYKKLVDYIFNEIKTHGARSAKHFESPRAAKRETWRPSKDTTRLLEVLWYCGYLVIVKRNRGEKYYDLIEHIVPQKLLHIPSNHTLAEQRFERYIQFMRITTLNDPYFSAGFRDIGTVNRKSLVQKLINEGKADIITLPGQPKSYIASRDFLEQKIQNIILEPMFIAPLDNILWNRNRLEPLFDFYYRWEIYTPAIKRKVGPYNMPILAENQFIGQANVKYDRQQSILHITSFNTSSFSASQFNNFTRSATKKLQQFLGAKKNVITKG